MDLIKEYTQKSKFRDEKKFFEIFSLALSLGVDESEYKEIDAIHKKEAIILLAINFIESILSADLAATKQEKLSIINLLDELNFRSEVLQSIANKKFSIDLFNAYIRVITPSFPPSRASDSTGWMKRAFAVRVVKSLTLLMSSLFPSSVSQLLTSKFLSK